MPRVAPAQNPNRGQYSRYNPSNIKHRLFRSTGPLWRLHTTLLRLLGPRKLPVWVRKPILQTYASMFRVDQAEIPGTWADYSSLQAFFSRPLPHAVRPQPGDPHAITSPADGLLSAVGPIRNGTVLQAKGIRYRVQDLLGSAAQELPAATFEGGSFATIYLAPGDYHRFHMPSSARVVSWTDERGSVYPVQSWTLRCLPSLFIENQRRIYHLDADGQALAVIAIAAAGVSAVRNASGLAVGASRTRGDELGRFELGSTIVILLPRYATPATRLGAPATTRTTVRVGQVLAHWPAHTDEPSSRHIIAEESRAQ